MPVNSTSVGSRSYSNLLFQSKVIGSISDNDTTYATFGFNILTSSPMSFLRAGYHSTAGTGVNTRGGYGYSWSKSSYSTTNAYYLAFGSSNVYPRLSYYAKAYGFTVRCVAL